MRVNHKLILMALLLISLCHTPYSLLAQQNASDTLRLTIPQAESIFLQHNLALLAGQYNIDINKALAKQAKVWDNPTLLTDQNLYDGKFFRHDKENGQQYGQVYIQVQQLIRTASKIKKQSKLAEDNVSSAEAQFNEIMRNLKFVLSTDLNNLSQLQNTASIYQSEISTVQTLAKGMDEMLKTGDISQKENVRVKALLFSLETEYSDNIREQYDLEKEIASLLKLEDNIWIKAIADQSFDTKQISKQSIQLLQDSAQLLRPDLAAAKAQNAFQEHNISYQKALGKPDLNVGIEYDRLNSYVPNYYGLTIALPLPVFNRNRGNIEAAQFSYKQSNIVVERLQKQVTTEVYNAWRKLMETTSLLSTESIALQSNYDVLMQNMITSYRQRLVSLTEFIDFFDAYKETRIKEWKLITDQRNAAAELNFVANQSIIPL